MLDYNYVNLPPENRAEGYFLYRLCFTGSALFAVEFISYELKILHYFSNFQLCFGSSANLMVAFRFLVFL